MSLGAFFWLFLRTQPLALLAQAPPPVPEFHGTYVVAHGQLLGLDGGPSQFSPRQVTVQLGHRAAVADVLHGRPLATRTATPLPELPPDTYFMVFRPRGLFGLGSADVAGSLRLQPLLHVRNIAVDTGWPQNLRRDGREDAWDSGAPTELLGLGDALDKPVRLLTKPMNGQPDVTLAVPAAPLTPGVYELVLGFGLLGTPTFRFAVGPLEQAQAAKCVDASYRYTVNISEGHTTPCGAPPSAPSGEAAPATPPVPVVIPPCEASGVAYDLRHSGQLYRVRRGAIHSGGGANVTHVFTDESGAIVRDQSVLHNLAQAAWIVDNVVEGTNIADGRRVATVAYETAIAHVGYSLAQDFVIRANVEALKAAATGGATLSVGVPGVFKGMVASRITSLRSWLLGMALLPLKEGLSNWNELARTAPRPAADAFDVQALFAVRRVYSEARTLSLPSAALANAMLPKSWDDLVERALVSFSSQVLAHPEIFAPAVAAEAVTFKHLLDAQRVVANAIAAVPELRPYGDNLNLVLRLRESEDRAIAQIASAAADACPGATPEGVPILPYVEREAHPFEGATYRAWVARSPLQLHEEPREGSRVLTEIAAGSQIVAETGETHTVRYGRILVERPRTITASLSTRPGYGDLASYGRGRPLQVTLAPGATLLSVGCYGEGACRYWYGGRPYDFDMGFSIEGWAHAEEAMVSEWWVLVRTAEGVRGWVKDPSVEGADAFS